MRRKEKNLFKEDLEPNYTLRKLTVTLSLVVVVLGAALVYRSIQAGQLQEAFFPTYNMMETVNKSLEDPKIEVTQDNTSLDKAMASGTEKEKGDVAASKDDEKTGGSDYFLNYAMQRDSARAQQVEMLTKLIDNKNTDAETKKTAQDKIIAITDALEDELLLTNLLNAKYNTETAVFVQKAQVNVIIKGEPNSLEPEEVEKIAQMVESQTDVGYENVIIVLKK